MLDLTRLRGLDQELLVDTSEGQPQYLLVSDREDYIKLSPSAYRLLKAVAAGRSFESLAEDLSRRGGATVSSAAVEAAYATVADQIGQILGRENPRPLTSGGFWFRLVLLPADVVAFLASRLSFLYHPAIVTPLLGFILATFSLMLRGDLRPSVAGGSIWLGYLLFIASLLVHELGHAAACSRFGAKPSEVGFTLYLAFPAFYSDVTSAWQLTRRQRVIVDLGGTFFQFVVAALFATAYFVYGWEPLRIGFLMIWYGALFSLNPIFKFDGYWVLADALGVTNLSKQPALIATRLLHRLTRRHVAQSPWPRWVALVLIVYTPVTFLVWGYFVVHLVPFLVASTLAYPAALVSLYRSLVHGAAGRGLLQQIGTFFASTMIVALTWYGLWAAARASVRRFSLWFHQARAKRASSLALAR
jgi:putative peptide zinc metalloprotease protein